MTTLLLEPFGGLAGDMLLAALLDLDDERFRLEDLVALAERLVPGEAELTLTETRRRGLRARHLRVRTPESAHAPHRHLADLLERVERADLPARARERATGALRRLAEAEADVHGIAVDAVHFHEVGAVDTLIDVAGAALALELLDVERVLATPPALGDGTVRCAHGTMPVPAPATAKLMEGLPTRRGGTGERLTPTGAALLAELADFEGDPTFVAARTGYGAGSRDPDDDLPNLVRVRLGAPASSRPAATTLLEFRFQLDDATGEEIAFCLERLRDAGALDVWTAPLGMKKSRPGVLVEGLLRPADRDAIERAAFDHSTTLGLRFAECSRTECERESLAVEVDGHAISVKRRRRPHAREECTRTDLSPEHDDLARVARVTGRTLRDLELAAIDRALASLAEPRRG